MVYTLKLACKLLYARKIEGLCSPADLVKRSIVEVSMETISSSHGEVFCWRVLHEFLSARQILHRRHIEPVAFCEVPEKPERIYQTCLLDCSVSKEF